MIRRLALAALAAVLSPVALAQGSLNLYCSSPNTAWCQGMAVGFEKATGTKVAVIQKATGEMLAQVKAEKDNPKGDVWWAGPGDSYLQAAEEGLLDEYRSPNVAQLYPWAQRITEVSKGRVSGVYGGIIALGYNTEIVARRKLPVPACWKDLLAPHDPAGQGLGSGASDRVRRHAERSPPGRGLPGTTPAVAPILKPPAFRARP